MTTREEFELEKIRHVKETHINVGRAMTVHSRTEEQRAYDHGVMAATEIIRLVTGDEHLALLPHALLTWKRDEYEVEVVRVKG